MKKYYLVLVFCILSLVPLLASAAVSLFPFGYWGEAPNGLLSCVGINCTTCDLFATGQRIIYFIMTLTLFVVGPIMITAGGIMMLVSGGSPEKFSSGRKMATGAVIGILIALGAFLIIYTLLFAVAKQIPGFNGTGFSISCAPGTKSPYVDPSVPATGNFSGEQYNPPPQTEPGGMNQTF